MSVFTQFATQQPTGHSATLDAIVELTDNQRVVTDGPLSALYANALNELYAKKTDPLTGLAIESAANDQLMAQSQWIAARASSDAFAAYGEAVGMLYGVKKDEVHLSDVVLVGDTLSEMTEAQKANSAIIIDAKETPGAPGLLPEVTQAVLRPFEQALEGIALYHGVAVYASLEAYLADRTQESKHV